MKTAIQAAQEIVDSTVDTHPEYDGKRVTGLCISPETQPLSVQVHFQDGTSTTFIGTWAGEILRHFPDNSML